VEKEIFVFIINKKEGISRGKRMWPGIVAVVALPRDRPGLKGKKIMGPLGRAITFCLLACE